MKRTPLRRKTPLRGGRLQPRSASKQALWPQYQAAVQRAMQLQVAQRGYNWCERCEQRCEPGPHHTGGRVGANLLRFVLMGWSCCHEWVHLHPNEARKEGLLR